MSRLADILSSVPPKKYVQSKSWGLSAGPSTRRGTCSSLLRAVSVAVDNSSKVASTSTSASSIALASARERLKGKKVASAGGVDSLVIA